MTQQDKVRERIFHIVSNEICNQIATEKCKECDVTEEQYFSCVADAILADPSIVILDENQELPLAEYDKYDAPSFPDRVERTTQQRMKDAGWKKVSK